MFLKQSTAVVVTVGGFWDKADGVTPETGLTGMTNIYLHKAGGDPVARNSAVAITYPTNAGGHYSVPLSTTDTNTLGILRVHITESGIHLGVWQDYMVMNASAYNFLFGSSDPVDLVLDEVIESTITFREALRIFLSALAGKSSGGGTSTIAFRDVADTKNRISATVDSNGNRTAIGTRDGT